VDRSTDLASGCFSFSSTWCRSLLLRFSTCYLGILGLEEAINCVLARTSHQRTTSKKGTKALLPKCPLFGGSTVVSSTVILEMQAAWNLLASFPGSPPRATTTENTVHRRRAGGEPGNEARNLPRTTVSVS